MATMGREQPTVVLRPNQNRREERARRAKDTKNKWIPDLMRSCPRAKHGVAKVELIVDPPPVVETPQTGTDPFPRHDLKIRVRPWDTLYAASRVSEKQTKRNASSVNYRPSVPNVAILNMASAFRPGGGFLEGANSQEEFLCTRTTVYQSLWEQFYRMPEVSGIFTPDVLVFRDHLPEANELPKSDRYFVDVISSSMLRFSDAKGEGCTCGVSYCDKHRDLVLRKMKAVLRIAQSKGVEKLILGAWGCGAYGNPVKEIAKHWRKVIAGAARQRRPNAERWDGINEIIFAIPDRTMYAEFERAFSDVLAAELPSDSPSDSVMDDTKEHQRTDELLTKIAEVELQIEQVRNVRLKNTLRDTLGALQKELNQSSRAKASADEDRAPEEDRQEEVVDDYVVSGYPLPSDIEDNSFYNLADDLSDDSGGRPHSDGNYEFQAAPSLEFPSHDEESQDDSLCQVGSHSPNFDPQTGWFNGSMDGLTALLRTSSRGVRSCSRVSPGSPDMLRPTSSAGLGGLDADAVDEYLRRYQGSDVKDY